MSEVEALMAIARRLEWINISLGHLWWVFWTFIVVFALKSFTTTKDE